MAFKFSKSNRDALEKIVSKAVALFESGNALATSMSLGMDRYLFVLGNSLKVDGSVTNTPAVRSLIRSALSDLSKSSDRTLKTLEIAIEQRVGNRSQFRAHRLLFQINVEDHCVDPLLDIWSTLERSVQRASDAAIAEWLSMREQMGANLALIESRNDPRNEAWVGTWVELQAYGYNLDYAYERASAIAERLRALSNYAITAGRVHYQSSPQQLTKLSPTLHWILFDDETGSNQSRYTVGQFNRNLWTLSDNDMKNVSATFELFSKAKKSALKDSVLAAIDTYTEALDSSQRDYAFLLLWSIFDRLLATDKPVSSLMSNLYSKGKVEQRLLLDALYAKRNLLVHQSNTSGFVMDDVNLLKSVVENLIDFAISAMNAIETPKDLALLLLRLESRSEIDRRLKILNYARSLSD